MRTTKLICILLWAVTLFTSCRDEFPMSRAGETAASEPEKPIEGNRGKGLVPYQYGEEIKWKAVDRRVPMVGVGRVVNRLFPDLVTVVNNTSDVTNITDTDITNSVVFNMSAVNVKAGGPLVSVRDMYRTYAAGQQVGFVYRVSSVETLKIDLLKGLYLRLYKNGQQVGGDYVYSEGEGGVLGISLLNLPTGNSSDERIIAVTANDDFDEVVLGTTGIDVGVLSTFEVKYAFVGETPEVPIVQGSELYPNPSIIDKTGYTTKNVHHPERTINSSLEDNAWFTVPLNIIGLFNPKLAIKVGKEIPEGTEVGFVTKSQGLAGINLLGKSGAGLSTYSYNGGKMDKKESIKTNTALLGVSLLQGSDKQHISMITQKPCDAIQLTYSSGLLGVSLSSTDIFYAYTREATKVDITSYFVIADDVTTFSSYQFPIPEVGEVKYTYLGFTSDDGKQPEGTAFSTTKPGRLTNMTVNGKYKVQATYTYNGETVVQTAVITRKAKAADEKCNILITDKEPHYATIPPPEGPDGCLLCVLDSKDGNPMHVIDGNLNTSVLYNSTLGVAKNTALIAVKTQKPIVPSEVDTQSGTIRAGFIVQGYSHLLDLTALQYYYIRFYLGSEKVDQKVAELNTTVGLDLIQGGSGDNNKMRLCAKTDKQFDRMELWIGGIANVIDRLRIYDAFYEPASSVDCSGDAAEYCMEMMTPISHGLEFDPKHTNLGTGLVGIGGALSGLDKILDSDKNSYAILTSTNVLAATSLGFKFNKQTAGQAIGIILGKPGEILEADVLKAITFKVYNDDMEVGSAGQGSVLGADVIAHGYKMYIEVTPNVDFNRIRLLFGSAVQLFDNYKVYGVYMRPDTDGDGVPDCGEDKDPDGSFTILSKEAHVCEGESIVIDKVYGTEGDSYNLIVKTYQTDIPQNGKAAFPEEGLVFKNVPLRNNSFTITKEMMKTALAAAGITEYECFPPLQAYYVNVAKKQEAEEENISVLYYNYPVTVHPLRATWKGGDTEKPNDWNSWNNWVEGSPWKCTDVVIPAGLTHYPVLKNPNATEGLSGNFCERIQFLSGAEGQVGEVVNTQYLTYEQAFVDMTFQENKHYMLAAPLKDVYTGDIFSDEAYDGVVGRRSRAAAADYKDCWQVVDWKNKPLDRDFRFTPRVFQHFFGGYVTNITGNGEEQLLPGDENWTAPFNLVAQKYNPATGFLVRMGGEAGETRPQAGTRAYRVRFPKGYNYYYYYDEQEQQLDRKEGTPRNADAKGRFIYEDDNRKVKFPLSIQLENNRPGNTYLAGNPFMCHLDLKAFFDANVAVGSIKVLREGRYVEVERNASDLTSVQVRPMEAFLMIIRPPYSETSRYRCMVHFVPDMLTAGKQ